MCEDIAHILETERKRKYRYSMAITAMQPYMNVVGWALVQPVPYRPTYSAQFFVDPAHRRQGIGARLLQEANKYTDRPLVYKDCDNEEFFNKFPELCKADY